MRRQNPDKGLKLIGDSTAEDSDAKYFLAMLKYRSNPVDPEALVDPEAMALLQEISGGPSPPDGRWKNPNLWRLRYLIKKDLEDIAWWYWLYDGDDGDITSAFGERDIGATGRIPKRSSTTVVMSVASAMSSTSGRVTSPHCEVRHQQNEHRDVGASINEHYLP
jgi:hypothetical protein